MDRMSVFAPQTRAEQRLAWLESLERPLTDYESDMLRRSLHAVYWHNRKLTGQMAMARREELVTLRKMQSELRQRPVDMGAQAR